MAFALGPGAAGAQAACATGWSDDGSGGCEYVIEYSGAPVTVPVPAGVHVLSISAGGAAEGRPSSSDAQEGYGFGGFSSGELSVTPGEQLIAVAGGQGQAGSNGTGAAGGYGGGGHGGDCHTNLQPPYGDCGPNSGGSGGGGGSFVWANGKLVLVAGGAGADSGGDGGGQTGDTGCCLSPDPNIYGGTGGTQSAGGQTGYCDECGANSAPGGAGTGPAGGPGSFGQGGDGGTYPPCTASECVGGAGGGGGYYGGGGGTALTGTLGGGGGSGYVSSQLANASTIRGAGAGYGRVRLNGHVTFDYQQPSTQISGTITTPFGDGWANATVQLSGTDSTTNQQVTDSTTTDSNGGYSFALNPGTYTVTPIVAAAYLPAGADLYTATQCAGSVVKDTCASIALAADQSAVANFTAGYTVTGTVTGVDGSGVPNATVHFVDSEQNRSRSLTATTDSQGQIVSSAGASKLGVQLAPGMAQAYVDTLQDGTKFFPVPSPANDPDCVPSGDRCQVNLNHDRDVGFAACVVPNPDGSPLPPPLDTSPSVPIPGAITTGNVEAVGCWKPTDSTDFNTATKFTSDKPVRLDGLDLLPAAGEKGEQSTTFALDKSARTVTVEGAPAVLQVGGIALWEFSPGSVLDFNGSAFTVEDLGLGEAYGGIRGPQLGGLPLALSHGSSFATMPWQFSPGQTSLQLNPVVPTTNKATGWDWQKGEFHSEMGKIPNVGPQFVFRTTNREGLLITNTDVCGTFGDKSLIPWQWDYTPEDDQLSINGITACINLHTRVWSLSGLFEIKVPGAPDRVSVMVSLHKFDLMHFSTLVDGFNEPMALGLYFQRVGVAATWDVTKSPPVASSIELSGGISFGPQITDSGSFKAIYEAVPLLRDAELFSMDMSGDIVISNPYEFVLKGTLYAFRRSTFQMALASGEVDWWPVANQFNFHGDLTSWPIVPGATLTANLSGWLALDRTHSFQIEAGGSLKPIIGSAIPGNIVVNNNLVAACSPAFGTGYVRYWSTNTATTFPAGDCGLGQYAIRNPTPGAARDGPSGTAASFRIPAGLASTALQVRGKSGPPVLTLSGPQGQSVKTPASGTLHTGDFWVSVDRSTNTTYIAIAHPAAGIWRIHTIPGSSAIAHLMEANPAPQPRITGQVRLSGCAEKLTYTYHPVAGDNIALYAQNGSRRTFFGDARPGRHALRFVPALTGAGQIVAVTIDHGVPSRDTVLVGFAPGHYKNAATPRNLRVNRGVLSWTGACDATGYTVTTASGQTTTTQTTRATHVKLLRTRGAYTVTVDAAIAGGGLTSASARFR